jgi:rRNA-processing protein FCF1
MLSEPKQAKKSIRIIFDSNALFVPIQFKINILEKLQDLVNKEFEPILLSPVKRELERLAEEGSPAMQKKASYALKLAEKLKSVDVKQESGNSTDDVIFAIAKSWECPVFTNDRKLRKRLRDINVPTIYVRHKSKLEIDGRI